jgi:glycosyltransferase involved in cell wall biosynthesis
MGSKHVAVLTVSIITPSFNQGKYINETIRSVLAQRGDFYVDYIIMDGGSKDETVEMINGIEEELKRSSKPIDRSGAVYYAPIEGQSSLVHCKGIRFRWFSEKDKGQLDALRNGFALAEGEIYAWINSDDYYYSDATLAKICRHFDAVGEKTGLVYGKGIIVDENGKRLRDFHSKTIEQAYSRLALNVQDIVLQPSAFMRSWAYKAAGGIDPSFHYAMDWDLWQRISRVAKVRFIPEYLSYWRQYPVIKPSKGKYAVIQENFRVIRKSNGLLSGLLYCLLHLAIYPGYWAYAKRIRRDEGGRFGRFTDFAVRALRACLVRGWPVPYIFRSRRQGLKRMAVVAPYSPQKTEIVDFNDRLIDAILAKHDDILIDIYTEPAIAAQIPENPRIRFLDHKFFDYYYRIYDYVLYVMGSKVDFQSLIPPHIKRGVGAVEFYDLYFSQFYRSTLDKLSDKFKYFRRKKRIRHLLGILKAYARQIRHEWAYFVDLRARVLSLLHLVNYESYFKGHFYRATSIVRKPRRLIVRAESVRKESGFPKSKTQIIPLPTVCYECSANLDDVRERFGIPRGYRIVLSLDYIHQTKMNDTIAMSVRTMNENGIKTVYICGGEDWWEGERFITLLRREGLNRTTIQTNWLSDSEWKDLIQCCDVGVSLSTNLYGGHPGSIARFIGFRKPVIILDDPIYAAFPETVFSKILKDGDIQGELAQRLKLLLTHDEERARISKSQEEFVRSTLGFDKLVDKYLAAAVR